MISIGKEQKGAVNPHDCTYHSLKLICQTRRRPLIRCQNRQGQGLIQGARMMNGDTYNDRPESGAAHTVPAERREFVADSFHPLRVGLTN